MKHIIFNIFLTIVVLPSIILNLGIGIHTDSNILHPHSNIAIVEQHDNYNIIDNITDFFLEKLLKIVNTMPDNQNQNNKINDDFHLAEDTEDIPSFNFILYQSTLDINLTSHSIFIKKNSGIEVIPPPPNFI